MTEKESILYDTGTMEPPPLVGPDQALLNGYVLRLPFPMARRVENGSLVFWHTPDGLTFWIDAYRGEGEGDPIERWRDSRSPAATDECVEREDGFVRLGYRLREGGTAREAGSTALSKQASRSSCSRPISTGRS